MEVNELRVGNFITHDDYSMEVFKVMSIEKNEDMYLVDTEGGKNGSWINGSILIEPVPLSEEILVKLGKEPRNRRFIIKALSNEIRFDYNFQSRSWFVSLNGKFTIIENIHQLQNLYFGLTGKELEIDLVGHEIK